MSEIDVFSCCLPFCLSLLATVGECNGEAGFSCGSSYTTSERCLIIKVLQRSPLITHSHTWAFTHLCKHTHKHVHVPPVHARTITHTHVLTVYAHPCKLMLARTRFHMCACVHLHACTRTNMHTHINKSHVQHVLKSTQPR